MEVKILKPFTDKYDRSVKYGAGDIAQMAAARVKEVNSTWRGQLVEIISDEKPKAKGGRKPKAKEG